jgi:hypothetical protein
MHYLVDRRLDFTINPLREIGGLELSIDSRMPYLSGDFAMDRRKQIGCREAARLALVALAAQGRYAAVRLAGRRRRSGV